jgi:acyl carrier protein phosphodiesterase
VNYLAHAALAEDSPHSLIGNLAGDHVKGPLGGHALHPEVAAGVRRHRMVDGLTDRHPTYVRLRERFPRAHRRYAGIVLDVLFDHFLSDDWEYLRGGDRDAFIDRAYGMLGTHHHLVPEPFAAMLPHWIAADWLRVYASLEGLDAVFRRLAGRLREPTALHAAWAAVRDERETLRGGFRDIFVDVRTAVETPGIDA